MTDELDPVTLIEAAQQAAGSGDFSEAERLLREAAAAQESRLGADHPDLAITLNNLALVCERTNKFDEAERGYRRAHAIAVTSLAPGHPFIETSLQNLVDFCAAHDIPIWKAPPPAFDPEIPSPEPETAPLAEPAPVAVPDGTWSPRTLALTALAVAVVVAVVVFAVRGPAADAPGPPPQGQNIPPAEATPDTSTTITAPAQQPPLTETVEKPAETPAALPPPVERPDPPETPETSTAPASVTVMTAQVCSDLERTGSPDWQCTRVSGESQPGIYMFYTRLVSDMATTVEHRWYHGDRVHQVMRLRVAASSERGFRTFSSNTISPERAGAWRVELRGADGSVLGEERFVIR